MSAELLREAAALMRERAEAATTGPWVTEQDWIDFGVPDNTQTLKGSGKEDPIGIIYMHYTNKGANGAYIASWHPAVALAVAYWLEECANFEEHLNSPTVTRDASRWKPHQWKQAVAVARAYLGRQS